MKTLSYHKLPIHGPLHQRFDDVLRLLNCWKRLTVLFVSYHHCISGEVIFGKENYDDNTKKSYCRWIYKLLMLHRTRFSSHSSDRRCDSTTTKRFQRRKAFYYGGGSIYSRLYSALQNEPRSYGFQPSLKMPIFLEATLFPVVSKNRSCIVNLNFQTTSYEVTTKTKVVDLKKVCNYVVDNFFI